RSPARAADSARADRQGAGLARRLPGGASVKLSALLCLSCTIAHADPSLLRFATIAPDGTAWARELKVWASDIERESGGKTRIKLYFGALAGDEPEMAERIRKGQLDGLFGSMACHQAAPSLRVTLVVGLFQRREEASWLVSRLKQRLDKAFIEHGFTNLGEAGLGSIILFSRNPIASMLDRRRAKVLVWTRDNLLPQQLPLLGITSVRWKLEEGLRPYLDGSADAFVSAPSAALAFQWSPQARWFTDLRLSFIVGCGMIATRALDALPIASQQALLNASAK